MDCQQEQEEEREVLLSIYEEDDRFKQVDQCTYQYKFGEDAHFKSFVLEIKWTPEYPESAPHVNMNAFYNKHISSEVKGFIVSQLEEQCELNLGCAMTYTLIDWTNEHLEELTENQKEIMQQSTETINKDDEPEDCDIEDTKKEKKEKLTKQQKRKLGNRLNAKGELERGWNWVDVVRHLSKTAST